MAATDVIIKCEEFIENEVHPDDGNNTYFNIYETRGGAETDQENDENRFDENDCENDDIKMQDLLRKFDLEFLFTILKFGDITYRSLKYISENDINTAIRSIAYRAEFREKLFAWRRDKYGLNDFSVLPPPKTPSNIMPLGVNNSNNIQPHNTNTYNTNAPSRVTPNLYDHTTTTTTTAMPMGNTTNTRQQPSGIPPRTRRQSTPKTNSAKKPRITNQAPERQTKRTANSPLPPPSPTPTASQSMTSPTPTLSDTMSLLQQDTSRMDSHASMEYDDPLCYQPTTSSAAAAATQPTGSMKSDVSAPPYAQPKMSFEKLKTPRSRVSKDKKYFEKLKASSKYQEHKRKRAAAMRIYRAKVKKYKEAIPTDKKEAIINQHSSSSRERMRRHREKLRTSGNQTSKSVNKVQCDILIGRMQENPDVARGYVKENRGKVIELWKSLVLELNDSGPPFKSESEWKKVWTDQKRYVRKKAAACKQRQTKSGNLLEMQKLTPSKEMIFELIGMDDDEESVSFSRKCRRKSLNYDEN